MANSTAQVWYVVNCIFAVSNTNKLHMYYVVEANFLLLVSVVYNSIIHSFIFPRYKYVVSL